MGKREAPKEEKWDTYITPKQKGQIDLLLSQLGPPCYKLSTNMKPLTCKHTQTHFQTHIHAHTHREMAINLPHPDLFRATQWERPNRREYREYKPYSQNWKHMIMCKLSIYPWKRQIHLSACFTAGTLTFQLILSIRIFYCNTCGKTSNTFYLGNYKVTRQVAVAYKCSVGQILNERFEIRFLAHPVYGPKYDNDDNKASTGIK